MPPHEPCPWGGSDPRKDMYILYCTVTHDKKACFYYPLNVRPLPRTKKVVIGGTNDQTQQATTTEFPDPPGINAFVIRDGTNGKYG